MANALDITLHASGQELSSTSGAAVDIGENRSACRLWLSVSEVTGGALTVLVETSEDGTAGWRQVTAFPIAPASTTSRKTVSCMDCDRYVRVRWTLATSATFHAYGTAHTLIAYPDDVYAEVPGAALGPVPTNIMADKLISASCDAEDAITRTRHGPLTKWSASMRRRVACIAAYMIVKWRGFNPDNAADELILRDAERAERWLEKVGKDEVRPAGTEPQATLPRRSSGNPDAPQTFRRRMSDNWGSF